MVKITLIDSEASSHEEFAELILPYGKKGYVRAYFHEDLDEQMILTDGKEDFDPYDDEEDFEVVIGLLKQMNRGQIEVRTLPSGKLATLVKEN